jgi:hypothetical protein
MKKLKCLMIMIGIMTMIAGYSQVRSKEEMVKRIFSVFKNKDEEGFIKLFPDAATLTSLVTKIIEADTSVKDPAKIKSALNEINDSSLRAELHRNFIKFLKMGEEKGVNWSQASFESCKIDSALAKQGALTAPKLSGSINFTTGDKEYLLDFTDVTWLENRGWYGVKLVRVDERMQVK